MAVPSPGKPVRGSKTGRPIMALLDLLGRRWALRILWELHQRGPTNFRSLQKHCGDISPTVLNSRLRELRDAGIVDLREGEGYVITAQGRALGKIIDQLNTWAKAWASRSTSPSSRQALPKTRPQTPTH